jgi:RNA polymerase sigma-70 factor (ECF subfamily)
VAEGSDRERVAFDRALMARIAAGDQTAFAGVAREQAPRLLRFVRSLLADSPAEAEEIVQEALLRLWRQAADWRPQGRISTWLHQVTYRLSIDSLRRSIRRWRSIRWRPNWKMPGRCRRRVSSRSTT